MDLAAARTISEARGEGRRLPAHANRRDLEPAQLRVELVDRLEDLAALEPEWSALARAAAEPNPFYEPWMVLPALGHHTGAARPRFALTWGPAVPGERRVLYGLFPLVERGGPALPRRIELWKYAHCYLCTPLVHAEARAAVLGAFFEWLERSQQMGRSVWKLETIPGSGPFREAMVEELRRRGWRAAISDSYVRAFFRPASSAEDYLERTLNKKRRKELRRQQARLSELGEVRFEALERASELETWIERFVRLEASGWKGRQSVAVAADLSRQRGFEGLCRAAHQAGRLMMLALTLDGEPVAMKMNLRAGDGAFAFKITYNEKYAKFSPGMLLELHSVERLHEEPRIRWMDSCAAPNRFLLNHLWAERREVQTLYVASTALFPSLAVAALPLGQWIRDRFRALARR